MNSFRNINSFKFGFVLWLIVALSLLCAFTFSMNANAEENNPPQENSSTPDDQGMQYTNVEVYNITVGNTIVGYDETKWQGEGDSRYYDYQSSSFSYKYYPSNNRLELLNGNIDGYLKYKAPLESEYVDVESEGIITANRISSGCKIDEKIIELIIIIFI